MAARLNRKHQESIREKIRGSQLVNVLEKHSFDEYKDGEKRLDPSQVAAIKILIDKVVPNLSAVEQTNINADTPEHMSDADLIAIAKGTNVEPIRSKGKG